MMIGQIIAIGFFALMALWFAYEWGYEKGMKEERKSWITLENLEMDWNWPSAR